MGTRSSMKWYQLGVAVSILLVVAVLWTRQDARRVSALQIGDSRLQVEIADTPERREQGLSGRERIGADGMLFVFDRPDRYPFWMKQMRFALDFVWIAEGEVVEITANVPEPTSFDSTDLTVYRPAMNISMMLEIPAGQAQRLGIEIGDQVILE